MPTLLQDLRFALRVLSKSPGFTAVAVLTLALGIGATSSVFNLVHGELLTGPPYAKPERIVLVTTERVDGQPYARGCAAAQWLEWQRKIKSFDALAGYHWEFSFLVLPDGSESVKGLSVTPDYFRVIGSQPELGRAFLPSEGSSKPVSTIIIAHELWK